MKFAAIVLGLIGITAVNGLAAPAQGAAFGAIQARQTGLITSLQAAIDSLQAQLTTVSGEVRDELQEQIDGLQAMLDQLLS